MLGRQQKTIEKAAGPGDLVAVGYTLRTEHGNVFASSASSGPLTFTVGTGAIIAGVEGAVIGMRPGESRTVKIPALLAFGEHLPGRVLTSPQGTPEIEEAWKNRARDSETLFSVMQTADFKRVQDYNHPLAGQQVLLDLELLSVD